MTPLEMTALRDSLNHLYTVCLDGQHRYREAASGVQDPETRTLLISLALQRAQLASELQRQVWRLGGQTGQPAPAGRVAAALRRGWLNLKLAVLGQQDQAIAAELARSEDDAISLYEEALRQPLPGEGRGLIERQLDLIQHAQERVQRLASADRPPYDPLDEQLMESFPASDAAH